MKRENLDTAIKIDKKLRRIETQLSILKENCSVLTSKIGDKVKVNVKDYNYFIDFDEIFTKDNIQKLIQKRESELIMEKESLEQQLIKL